MSTHFETIATFEQAGDIYEIDHLGIGYPDTQWGNFAIYRDGEMVAEFCIPESALNPEFRPELPSTDELTELAKGALAGDYASDEDVADWFASVAVGE